MRVPNAPAFIPPQQIEEFRRTDLVFRAEIEMAAGQHVEALRDVSEILENAANLARQHLLLARAAVAVGFKRAGRCKVSMRYN